MYFNHLLVVEVLPRFLLSRYCGLSPFRMQTRSHMKKNECSLAEELPVNAPIDTRFMCTFLYDGQRAAIPLAHTYVRTGAGNILTDCAPVPLKNKERQHKICAACRRLY
eukprot:GEMP01068595.1.p1 GENE.GEMP01068595.1~~GEMP01068595.1.p1  ORF type:complete len:109 (-),score=0.35 GEMP01068595.1:694-1020(-)